MPGGGLTVEGALNKRLLQFCESGGPLQGLGREGRTGRARRRKVPGLEVDWRQVSSGPLFPPPPPPTLQGGLVEAPEVAEFLAASHSEIARHWLGMQAGVLRVAFRF